MADLFADAYRAGRCGSFPPVPVTLTAGQQAAGLSLPKRELVTQVQVLLQQERLHFPGDLPDLVEVRRQLEAFQVKLSQGGYDTYEAASEAVHDDYVTALGLACRPPGWARRAGAARTARADGTLEGLL